MTSVVQWFVTRIRGGGHDYSFEGGLCLGSSQPFEVEGGGVEMDSFGSERLASFIFFVAAESVGCWWLLNEVLGWGCSFKVVFLFLLIWF